MSKTLVFIPTYNERENAERMFLAINDLALDLDVLFMDDNSPDGTGRILEDLARKHERLSVIHRTGKLGVGTAHMEGIRYAYGHDYDTLVTMDCDFTHLPEDIPTLINAARDFDVAVGSRFKAKGSLPGWNLVRRCLTWLGHALTTNFLNMPYDATGAFRVYQLRRVRRELFDLVTSGSYAFFFESLFILANAECRINEVAIVLPARTYGHSKMSLVEAARSARFLVTLWAERKFNAGRFRPAKPVALDPALGDPQDWDSYWRRKQDISGFTYEFIAGVYRRTFIKRNLESALRREFRPGASLLHAGCGSGQVDQDLHHRYSITAVDVSPQALYLYSQSNPDAHCIQHASIFHLSYDNDSFDGVYNLGVVEHFTSDEINEILRELRRVLKPGGKIVIFWPHRRASSVMVLKVAHFVLNKILKKDKSLHPPEITLVRSKQHARGALTRAGFDPARYSFTARDLFIQAVVVGTRAQAPVLNRDHGRRPPSVKPIVVTRRAAKPDYVSA
jgi:dolichol-phosphate mannosyltransferase